VAHDEDDLVWVELSQRVLVTIGELPLLRIRYILPELVRVRVLPCKCHQTGGTVVVAETVDLVDDSLVSKETPGAPYHWQLALV